VGIIGSHAFQQEHDATLKPGQTMTIGDYKLVYFGNTDNTYPDVEIIQAELQVWHNGQLEEYIYPARQFYAHFQNEPASLISITTENMSDLYVFLADWQGAGQASFRVFLNPLVPLIWSGGIMMLSGGIICWWPERRRRRYRQIEYTDSREISSAQTHASSPQAEPAIVSASVGSANTDEEASV
jgi:cytochrome c-type biogenesis protein CcmF